MRRLAVLILLAAVGAVAGCGTGYAAAQRDFADAYLDTAAVRTLADAAAQEAGEPPITIVDVKVEGSAGEATVTVSAEVGSVCDAWNAAGRAAQFGALVTPGLMANQDVGAVVIDFAHEARVVVCTYTRADADLVDWSGLRGSIDDDASGWSEYFTAASAYSWNMSVWHEVTDRRYPDSASAQSMPGSKP
jgi:hypothetical protein